MNIKQRVRLLKLFAQLQPGSQGLTGQDIADNSSPTGQQLADNSSPTGDQVANPPSEPGTTTVPTTPTTLTPIITPSIDIRSFPNVKTFIFNNHPQSWNFLTLICNKINSGLATLTKSKLDFRKTVVEQQDPMGEEYSGTLKNLVMIARFLYTTVTFNTTKPYLPSQIKDTTVTGLLNMIKGASYPDAYGTSLKGELQSIAQNWLTSFPA